MGYELPENFDMEHIQTTANIVFGMILEALYNGKSEDYKKVLNDIRKEGCKC